MRKNILKVIAAFLALFIVIPIFNTNKVDAATEIKDAKALKNYIIANGAAGPSDTFAGSDYSDYKVLESSESSGLASENYCAIMVNPLYSYSTDFVLYFREYYEYRGVMLKRQIVLHYDYANKKVIDNQAVCTAFNGTKVTNSTKIGLYTMPVTVNYDERNTPDPTLIRNAGFSELEEQNNASFFRILLPSMFIMLDELLLDNGFTLGQIGFTHEFYNHSNVTRYNWNGLRNSSYYNNTKTLSFTVRADVNSTGAALTYSNTTFKIYKEGVESPIYSGIALWQKEYSATNPQEIIGYKMDLVISINSCKNITAQYKCFPAGTYQIVIFENDGSSHIRTLVDYKVTVMNDLTADATNTPRPTITARPTDTVTPTSTSAPTTAPALPPFDPSAGGTGIDGFVSRLYSVVLGREGDNAGKDYWKNQLISGANTGADAARGFLTSPEFIDKNYTDAQFVEVLYRLFFNRTGVNDQAGINYWVSCLRNGQSRNDVITGFVNSTEWATICASYGINSGGTGIPQPVTDFASRLYTTCLGRAGEESGIRYWAELLASRSVTGTYAAHEFFFSGEFIDGNHSDREFVARLYKTFMGRDGSEAEIDYWASLLTNQSREAIFNGFAASDEFANLCRNAGINP